MSDLRCTLACPAKINLALSVGPPDPSGLHPIASWMMPIALFDTLSVMRAVPHHGRGRLCFAPDAPRPQPVNWPLECDLAYRAKESLLAATGAGWDADLEVAKRIPAGAGLGGGSSDAAGALWALTGLLGLNRDADFLMPIARDLGSDVMFALHALAHGGGALVGGFGEVIEPVTSPDPMHLTLCMPDVHCSTGVVYQAFDALQGGRPHAVATEQVRTLAHAGAVVSDQLFNDLADAACHAVPALDMARGVLRRLTRRPVHITGSGAAMFILTNTAEEALALADDVHGATGMATLATHTLSAPPQPKTTTTS